MTPRRATFTLRVMSDEEWMRRAIEIARAGIAAGQTPFGACIVKDRSAVACAHNLVWDSTDPTAHAEVNAIRLACQALGTIDLAGCTIYSTCEPCPMCFSACHWAKISRVVFGASIADARAAGFSEMPIANADMRRLGGSALRITGGVLRESAAALFTEWLGRSDRRAY